MGISREGGRLPREIFTRWISWGGVRVVLWVESRCVDMNAERSVVGVVPFLRSFFGMGWDWDSREKMCRYFPQGEKWHLTNSWVALGVC